MPLTQLSDDQIATYKFLTEVCSDEVKRIARWVNYDLTYLPQLTLWLNSQNSDPESVQRLLFNSKGTQSSLEQGFFRNSDRSLWLKRTPDLLQTGVQIAPERITHTEDGSTWVRYGSDYLDDKKFWRRPVSHSSSGQETSTNAVGEELFISGDQPGLQEFISNSI